SVAGWGAPLGGVAIGVVRRRGRWLAAVELGGGALVDGPLRVAAGILRLDVGLRAGALELRLGPVLAPIAVSDGGGDRTVLLGGGGSARVRVRMGGAVHVVLAGGVDVFATRTAYRRGGMPVLDTPRWTPWVGA